MYLIFLRECFYAWLLFAMWSILLLFFSIFPQLRNKEPFTDPSIDFSGEVTVIKFLSFKVLIFVGNATCCPKKDMQG